MSYTTPIQMLQVAGAIKDYINNKTSGTGGGNTAQAVDSLYAGVLTNPETGEPFFLSDLMECAGQDFNSNSYNKGEEPFFENMTDLKNKIINLTKAVTNICVKQGNILYPAIVAVPFIDAGKTIETSGKYSIEDSGMTEEFKFEHNNSLWIVIPHSLTKVSMIALSPHFIIDPQYEYLESPEWNYWETEQIEEKGMTGVDDIVSLTYIQLYRQIHRPWGNSKEIFQDYYKISQIFTTPLINANGVFPTEEGTSSWWPEIPDNYRKSPVTNGNIAYAEQAANELYGLYNDLQSQINTIKDQIGM